MTYCGFPGLGPTLADAAAKYARAFPGVTAANAQAWMIEARFAQKEPSRSRRATLVRERVQIARMMARAARIVSR